MDHHAMLRGQDARYRAARAQFYKAKDELSHAEIRYKRMDRFMIATIAACGIVIGLTVLAGTVAGG